MTEKTFFKTRLYFTGIVTSAIWLLLIWNHFHGGVPSHHILAREDLPEISNWWGGLLLPFLTFMLLYRVEKRLVNNNADQLPVANLPKNVVYGFLGALFFGITLSAFFTFGNTEMPGNMLLGLLFLSLFFPVYRAECILGFVIGMTYTFGAILPTGIGLILAAICAVIFLLIRPIILLLINKISNIAA